MAGNDGLCLVIERRGGNLICDLSEGTHCRLWTIPLRKNVREWPLADIPYVAFDVAFGVKRTCPIALRMSAFDPKRTSAVAF